MTDKLTIRRHIADYVEAKLNETFHAAQKAAVDGNLQETRRQLHNHHRWLSYLQKLKAIAIAELEGTDPEVARAGHDKELPPDPPPEDPPEGP